MASVGERLSLYNFCLFPMLNRKDFMYLEKTPAFPTGKQLFVTAVKQHL